jgi:hypothetical protein
MSRDTALVSAQWVEEHLDDPKVVLIEVDEDTAAYDKGTSRAPSSWTGPPTSRTRCAGTS